MSMVVGGRDEGWKGGEEGKEFEGRERERIAEEERPRRGGGWGMNRGRE